MNTPQLNSKLTYQLIHVGSENTPILIIDDVVEKPTELINEAGAAEQPLLGYQNQASDYYPGIRKITPQSYQNNICLALVSRFNSVLAINEKSHCEVIMSAFSIATTPPENLRPIQMLPHFDTPADNQFAMVHYLCDAKHGGTSLYRHKATSFERINNSKLNEYRNILKQQAIAEKLHQSPHYIEGDTRLFEQLYSVEAKMNRAVIYPSNILHSGNIRPDQGLFSAPDKGRLTISSFIVVND